MFDANEAATAKIVRCKHPKVICGPCALVLAQESFDEGVAEGRRLEREAEGGEGGG